MARNKKYQHENSLARRMAVQALYQSEITGAKIADLVESDLVIPEEGALPPYAVDLIWGVNDHLEEIDARIGSVSENWSVSRMPIVDRAILRAAVCEMYWFDEIPVSVSINEAVELAKAFGGEDESARFINGVLGRLSRADEAELAELIGSAEEALAEADSDQSDSGVQGGVIED